MNNEVLIRLTDAVPDGEFQFGEAVNIELHQGETLIMTNYPSATPVS